MSNDNPLEEFVLRYRDDPALFVTEVLGATPYDYQAEFLNALANGERKMSVRSGHGTGKSTTASWAMLWFVLLRFPNKVVVTAPTSGQLFDALFAELKRWINELPDQLKVLLTVKSDRVELMAAPSEAFISAGRAVQRRQKRWLGFTRRMCFWSWTRLLVCLRRCLRLLLGLCRATLRLRFY